MLLTNLSNRDRTGLGESAFDSCEPLRAIAESFFLGAGFSATGFELLGFELTRDKASFAKLFTSAFRLRFRIANHPITGIASKHSRASHQLP